MNTRRISVPVLGAPALCAMALVLALGGCAEMQLAGHVFKSSNSDPSAAPGGEYKVGQPYQINGETYVPTVDPTYDETGMASWYGAEFHGKSTANGDIYDMNALTAAHKTLPMPSTVRVTNLENGRSMVLTVNDRGPFVKDRVIDVSRRAAQMLGFQSAGTAQVRVQALSGPDETMAATELSPNTARPVAEVAVYSRPTAMDTELAIDVSVSTMEAPAGVKVANAGAVEAVALPPPPAAVTQAAATPAVATPATRDPAPGWYVQGGAFRNRHYAAQLKKRLASFGPAGIEPVTIDGTVYYRVRVGPVYDQGYAHELLAQVVEAGHDGARLVID